MSDPIITFDHVVKEFKTRGRGANIARAVDDVSLTIDRGDIFGIIGYSGCRQIHTGPAYQRARTTHLRHCDRAWY